MYTIYTLTNPENNEIFYVGATTKSLEKRLKRGHYINVYEARKGGRKWNKRLRYIDDLMKRGIKPLIEPVDYVENVEDLASIEGMYIQLFKSWNFNLTNSGISGIGGATWNFLTLEEQKLASKKMSEAQKGRTRSPEHIIKYSQAKMGEKNARFNKSKYTSILMKCPETGEVLQSFNHAKDVFKYFNVRHQSSLYYHIEGKKGFDTFKGYKWEATLSTDY